MKRKALATPADVLDAARGILPWMVQIRRELHQHPELGLEEHWTSARVQKLLDDLGIEHRDGIGGTGILGVLRGRSGDRTVALRADLDALPIQDAKDVPYRSKVPGKMHACGHDVHTTVLLGAARLLATLGDELPGMVKLLFQPAEETVGGAQLLIADGVLDNPKVDAVFGLHVEPSVDVGGFEVRYGQRNASSDTVHLTIHGRSGHGAYPAGTVDAIVVAAHVITALQTIVSRNVDARESAVLSLGLIRGGTAHNVVANRVELTGTVRTLDPEVRGTVLRRLRETAEGVAASLGAEAELQIERGYDPLINDDRMVDLVRRNAEALVGAEQVKVRPSPNMGVEDFGYYLSHVPGAFFSLGVRNEERGIVHSVHHDRFDVDEACLTFGVAAQVLNALAVLES
ncbi:MAG: M20 family metallopeptidase [Acidobacteriota bacterium]